MNIKKIRRGLWYRTKSGDGQCLTVGGTHPPSVQIQITHPFPRGRLFLSPRDVLEEIDPPKANTPTA